jgi:hypothetical protein
VAEGIEIAPVVIIGLTAVLVIELQTPFSRQFVHGVDL